MRDPVNVVLVVLDGARADHLSCYGYGRETTPFLDQVAHQGVRFGSMIGAAATTLPAHASLLTGLHPVTHGATEESGALSGRHKVVAEYLKGAGYRTGAFCTNPWVSPETGFGRGFDTFATQRPRNRLVAQVLSYGRKVSDKVLRREDAGARRSTLAFKRWVGTGGEPFCAVVHYNDARLPLQLPPPFDRFFVPTSAGGGRVRALLEDATAVCAGAVEMTEEDVVNLTARYDGALRYLDTRVRELAEFLRERGVWDRTLFIVTADHGTDLGEHGMLGHHWGLYDTVLRVPLVIRCPSHVPQGFVVEELTQHTDILPTILGVLGIPAGADGLPGRVLLEDGRVTAGPAFAVAERYRPALAPWHARVPQFDTRAIDVRQKAIRTRREKFIWHSDEANEYYDLAADPAERTNLIERDSERPDVLRRQLFDWLAAVENFEYEGAPPESDGAMRQDLQDVGRRE